MNSILPAHLSMMRTILTLLLFPLCCISARASPRTPQQNITAFRRFTTSEGLPGNSIIALATDSRGFLWIGTGDGLCRWDGARFYTPPEQYRFMQPPLVRGLHMLNDSLLLVSTLSGLCVYNTHSAQYENERVLIPTLRPGSKKETWVLPVSRRRLLVAAGQELYLLSPELKMLARRQLTPLRGDPHVILPHHGFFPTKDSSITALSHHKPPTRAIHIPSLRDTVWPTAYKWIDSVPHTPFFIAASLPRNEGALFSGWGNGLIQYSTSTRRRIVHTLHPTDNGSGNMAYAIAFDPSDRHVVWAGTGADLYSVNLHSSLVQHYHLRHADRAAEDYPNDIKALTFDRTGNLWVGTTNGLSSLSAQRAAYKTIPIKSKSAPIINNDVPYLDKNGKLWYGCWGFWMPVLDTNGAVLSVLKIEDRYPFNLIRKLVVSADTLYVASDGGFFFYDARGRRFHRPAFIPDTLHGRPAWEGTMRDSRGRWWVSFPREGLFCYDPATGKKQLYKGLGRDTIAHGFMPLIGATSIAEDRTGGIWVGHSHERGRLARLDPNTGLFQPVHPVLKGVQHDIIATNKIAVSPSGEVWFATSWYGVLCFNPARDKWTQYSLGEGLGSSNPVTVLVDWIGRVWALTDRGLAVLERGAATFRTLSAAEGVPFSSIQNIGIPDTTKPWRMLINNPTTLAWIDLRVAVAPVRTPRVFIEGIRVEGEAISGISGRSFSHKQSHFAFSFVAPMLDGGADVHYAYRLKGAEESWKDIGAERSVLLANVSPGRYAFEVRARRADGPWSPPARYAFSITPPFWRQWWFYALCAVALTGVVYAVYRYQLSKAIALLQVRNRISRDLHDEVGSTLSSISLMNEMAARSPDAQGLQKKIGDSIQKVQGAMSDIVWMINPKNDVLENLVLRFSEVAAELLEPRGIRYRFSVQEIEGLKLPMDVRRELYLIFKEVLNNIVKYASAGEVTVELASEGRMLRLRITDDGRGFDTARTTSGAGLHNIVERAKAARGLASIRSVIGNGTIVEVAVPV